MYTSLSHYSYVSLYLWYICCQNFVMYPQFSVQNLNLKNQPETPAAIKTLCCKFKMKPLQELLFSPHIYMR